MHNFLHIVCWSSSVFLFSLFFRECKQEGLQRKRETRMALLWQENGKLTINNPCMSFVGFPDEKMSKESVHHVSIRHPLLPQDVADFEWMMWFSTFRNHILFALTGHVIFAKIFTLIAPKVRACVWCRRGRKSRCECRWVLQLRAGITACLLCKRGNYQCLCCVCLHLWMNLVFKFAINTLYANLRCTSWVKYNTILFDSTKQMCFLIFLPQGLDDDPLMHVN